MHSVITTIRSELLTAADEKTRAGFQRFFKEVVLCYGVKSGEVSRIAKTHWKEIKNWNKPEIFQVCEELYLSGYCEEAFIVSSWMGQMSNRFEPDDVQLFSRWIDTYITNWATCDGFCNHAVGDFMVRFPGSVPVLHFWTQSPNRWMRRASAVSLILPARKGKFLSDVFLISDALLADSDDMVQKGYGWLLKESSRLHQDEVFSYVMKNKRGMPRTALRYAIELMPPDLRSEAMKKDWKS